MNSPKSVSKSSKNVAKNNCKHNLTSLLVGGFLTIAGGCISAYLNFYYLNLVEKNKNSYEFTQNYSKYYIKIEACREDIQTSILEISSSFFKDESNKYSTIDDLNHVYTDCLTTITTMLFISRVLDIKSQGLKCTSQLLRNLKSDSDEIIKKIPGSDALYARKNLDPLVLNGFSKKWDDCIKSIDNDLEKFSLSNFN